MKQNLYQQKINSLSGDVNSLKLQISSTEGKISELDNTISKLPSRISALRKMNYLIQTNMENDQSKAADKWAEIGSSVKAESSSRASTLKMELNSLERDISNRRISAAYDISSLTGLDIRINTLRTLVYDYNSRIEKEITPLTSILTPLHQAVIDAEEVVKLTSAASFQWMEKESPVVATHAKDMNEKIEGILTITNLRILYETEKEIVLKKTLFIVTEKKIQRTTTLDKPIGTVKSITKGNVGLLAGAGLFIEFKDGSNELKLDTKSDEADRVIRLYSLITSGQIDDDLKKTTTTAPKETEKKIVSCPKCGAPYTSEVYRGQQTVKCQYCGTSITV
jgi:hypothetical protein